MNDASDAEVTRNNYVQEEFIYHNDSPIEFVFDGLYAQSIVRDQPTEEVNKIIEKLKAIWEERSLSQISHNQLEQKITIYRNESLDKNSPADEETIIAIEESIVKIKDVSRKL